MSRVALAMVLDHPIEKTMHGVGIEQRKIQHHHRGGVCVDRQQHVERRMQRKTQGKTNACQRRTKMANARKYSTTTTMIDSTARIAPSDIKGSSARPVKLQMKASSRRWPERNDQLVLSTAAQKYRAASCSAIRRCGHRSPY